MNALDKLIVGIALLIAAFMLGMATASHYLGEDLSKLKTTYAVSLQLATDAKNNAEARNLALEAKATDVIARATNVYEKEHTDEKKHDDAVIAGLRNDVVRLSVRTNRAARGGEVPGPAAGPGLDHEAAPETLAGSVAARLAGRYADYNDAVGQLTACQAIVEADRLINP